MIDASSQLAALIRAQFGAQLRAQSKSDAPGTKPPTPDQRSTPLSSDAGQRLRELVTLRVRALSPDDPDRQRKAFRLFLESVLTQAFGRERLDDRDFDQLVDSVLERMAGDPQLHAALHEAGGLLLADAAPPGVNAARPR